MAAFYIFAFIFVVVVVLSYSSGFHILHIFYQTFYVIFGYFMRSRSILFFPQISHGEQCHRVNSHLLYSLTGE